MDAVTLAFAAGIIALAYAVWLAFVVLRAPRGNDKMQEISRAIQEGAGAYLARQYKTLAPFVVLLLLAMGFFIDWRTAGAFLAGVLLSALAGYVGMMVSVRANTRVAEAARKGLKPALALAFKGGAVTGMALAGLALVGVSTVYALFGQLAPLIGFGFGASLISLFARVGGGIYTKAADVGADLVGKIEKGIPEDDPRNPAVIADNVGDNVGDCAGMAADVFESFVVTIIAGMLLGAAPNFGGNYVTLPLAFAAVGVLASILGSFFVRLGGGAKAKIMHAFYKGIGATAV
ncbi:sodium/proton-translocating pyrophosphatase, partial [Candidatus Micrarchaeota archaeon]|nr:sodium/proton-translocating pyrophosphatase [Candidatus Micrarchaeota archaeon]